jgi:ATP-dependent RNA helicase DeaD
VLEPDGVRRERRRDRPERRERTERRTRGGHDPRAEQSFGAGERVSRPDTAEITAPADGSEPPSGPGFDEPGMGTLYLNVGRRDGVRVGEVARLVAEVGGLDRSEVGKIRVRDKHTFVSVPVDRLEELALALTGKTLADKPIIAEPAKAMPRA